jgi:hypothetical protein
MTDSQEWIRSGFARQRRNLMAASLALLAFQEIGAQLKKLSILGNEIELARPLRLSFPLWVMWTYFGIRYYQYLRDLTDRGFYRAVSERGEHLLRGAARAKLRKELKPDLSGFADPVWGVEVEGILPVGNAEGIAKFTARGHMLVVDRGTSKHRMEYFNEREIILKPNEPPLADIRAQIWVLLHTHRGTEYVLPFVVAALPLLVAAPALVRGLIALATR